MDRTDKEYFLRNRENQVIHKLESLGFFIEEKSQKWWFTKRANDGKIRLKYEFTSARNEYSYISIRFTERIWFGATLGSDKFLLYTIFNIEKILDSCNSFGEFFQARKVIKTYDDMIFIEDYGSIFSLNHGMITLKDQEELCDK
mgnify:FL=1